MKPSLLVRIARWQFVAILLYDIVLYFLGYIYSGELIVFAASAGVALGTFWE